MIWKGYENCQWTRKFAWFPTYTDDLKFVVWLRFYYEKYVPKERYCEKLKKRFADNPRNCGTWINTHIKPEDYGNDKHNA